MKWLEALKQWNAGHGGRWTIPKKGTPEHNQVLAIQGRTGAEEPDEETKAMVDAIEAEMAGGEAMAKPMGKKPRKKKTQDAETD